MRRIALCAIMLAGRAGAQATEAWAPPTLTTTRYDEDWRPDSTDHVGAERWTVPFKYIPLSGDAYVTTGLEVRARNEAYHSNGWGEGAGSDDGYTWFRVVPHADLHLGRVRAFVQPIAAYAAGVLPSASPIDQTGADLLQGFVDLRIGDAPTNAMQGTGVTIRAGRQMVSLGTERLIGTRYGPNVPLAFDGFRSLVSLGGATLTLLAVEPVEPRGGTFDDRRSRSRSLWAAYGTMEAGQGGIDLYYIGYRNSAATFGSRTGHETRHTFGARWFGTRADWHWNMEGAAQVGRFAEGPIGAWTLGTEVGRSFPASSLSPDIVLRVNVVSGDRRRDDARLGTFNALFPKGKYFGELSPVGPTNIVSVNPRVAAAVARNVTASLAGMAYWRYSIGDGVYDIPGHLVRAPGASRARFIGKEAEATLAWQATPELELSTSLSVFPPGRFIRETGPAKTIKMLGIESNFRF